MVARVVSGAVLAPSLIALVWWHPAALAVLAGGAAALTAREVARLVLVRPPPFLPFLAPAIAALLVALSAVPQDDRACVIALSASVAAAAAAAAVSA